jgi:hypothetical protein
LTLSISNFTEEATTQLTKLAAQRWKDDYADCDDITVLITKFSNAIASPGAEIDETV